MGSGNTGDDSLRWGRDERGWFVAARGSVRAMLCYPLREELLDRLENAVTASSVFIDLSACTYMDSTFIGLLVAIDRKLSATAEARLRILRPSPACRDLLVQLGLQDVLHIEEEPVTFPADMRDVEETAEKPGAEFILKAHEALMETSEEARRQFALLKETLEKKIRTEKPPRDTP